MIPLLVVAVAFAAVYWFPVRRWMGHRGTTSSDLTRVMAGDGLVVTDPTSYTMAIIVNAGPEHDWLDRLFGFLDRPSATRILPEFQHLAVGDTIPLPRGRGYPVAVVEPGRALVLDMRNMWDFDWVWEFGLYVLDERRTRLVSRSRVHPKSIGARLLSVFMIEPSAFFMTRRMLLGLKQRAEALAAAPGGPSVRAA